MIISPQKQCHNESKKHKHCKQNCVVHNNFITSLRRYPFSPDKNRKIMSGSIQTQKNSNKQTIRKKQSFSYIRPFRPLIEPRDADEHNKLVNRFATSKMQKQPPGRNSLNSKYYNKQRQVQNGEIQSMIMKVFLQKNNKKHIQKSPNKPLWKQIQKCQKGLTKQKFMSSKRLNRMDQVHLKNISNQSLFTKQSQSQYGNLGSKQTKDHSLDKKQIKIEQNITEPTATDSFSFAKSKDFKQLQSNVGKITNLIDMFNKKLQLTLQENQNKTYLNESNNPKKIDNHTHANNHHYKQQEQSGVKKSQEGLGKEISEDEKCINQVSLQKCQKRLISIGNHKNQHKSRNINDIPKFKYIQQQESQPSFNHISPIPQLQQNTITINQNQYNEYERSSPDNQHRRKSDKYGIYEISPTEHKRIRIGSQLMVNSQQSITKDQSTANVYGKDREKGRQKQKQKQMKKLNYKMFNWSNKWTNMISCSHLNSNSNSNSNYNCNQNDNCLANNNSNGNIGKRSSHRHKCHGMTIQH